METAWQLWSENASTAMNEDIWSQFGQENSPCYDPMWYCALIRAQSEVGPKVA